MSRVRRPDRRSYRHESPRTLFQRKKLRAIRLIVVSMTNDEAKLAVLKHLSECFFLIWDPEEDEDEEEAADISDEMAECLMGSIGLEVVSVHGDTITVTLNLRNNEEYINEWIANEEMDS